MCLDVLKKLRVAIRAASHHTSWIENQYGINGAQLSIMHELHDRVSLRVGELAESLTIHRTTTSNLLDDLERRRFVTKTRDQGDQRAVIVKLTCEGTFMLTNTPKRAVGLLPEALARMDEACLRQLAAGLQALIDSIEFVAAELSQSPQLIAS